MSRQAARKPLSGAVSTEVATDRVVERCAQASSTAGGGAVEQTLLPRTLLALPPRHPRRCGSPDRCLTLRTVSQSVPQDTMGTLCCCMMSSSCVRTSLAFFNPLCCTGRRVEATGWSDERRGEAGLSSGRDGAWLARRRCGGGGGGSGRTSERRGSPAGSAGCTSLRGSRWSSTAGTR